jgi:hypothetical protein
MFTPEDSDEILTVEEEENCMFNRVFKKKFT